MSLQNSHIISNTPLITYGCNHLIRQRSARKCLYIVRYLLKVCTHSIINILDLISDVHRKICSGKYFSELRSLGTHLDLTTNGSAKYLGHLSVKGIGCLLLPFHISLGHFKTLNINIL